VVGTSLRDDRDHHVTTRRSCTSRQLYPTRRLCFLQGSDTGLGFLDAANREIQLQVADPERLAAPMIEEFAR